FGDQYQWALCSTSAVAGEASTSAGSAVVEAALAYAAAERASIEQARATIDEASGRGPVVLWGMATKGVVFASLVGAPGLVGGIDVNAKKQHKFVPGSGLEIHPPEWLGQLPGAPTVIVMNPNYEAEIRARIAGIRPDVTVKTV
ncbi:MAG TPA: hypothetical protein VGF45_01640, partial [Polyangia bacterium]